MKSWCGLSKLQFIFEIVTKYVNKKRRPWFILSDVNNFCINKGKGSKKNLEFSRFGLTHPTTLVIAEYLENLFFTLENAKKKLELHVDQMFLVILCMADTMCSATNTMCGVANTLRGAADLMHGVANMMRGAASDACGVWWVGQD